MKKLTIFFAMMLLTSLGMFAKDIYVNDAYWVAENGTKHATVLWAWGDGVEGASYTSTAVEGQANLKKFTVPDKVTNYIFCRMAEGSTAVGDWSGVWNRANAGTAGTNNRFTINAWVDKSDESTAGGTWDTYVVPSTEDDGDDTEPTYQYVKVTKNLDDWTGEYLIVAEKDEVAWDGSKTKASDIMKGGAFVSVTITENIIAYTEDISKSEFTISYDATNKNYILKSASNLTIGYTGDGNNGLSSDASNRNTISYSDGNVVIQAVNSNGTYPLRENTNKNKDAANPIFKYYKSGQNPIQLYKKTEVKAEEPEVETVKVRFLNTANWDNVYAYAWEGTSTELNGAWPGGELTKGEDGWYVYNLKKGANIIFAEKDEGAQTQNIENVTADACYVWDKNYTDDNKKAVLNEACDGDISVEIPELYIIGMVNGNSWAPNKGIKMTATDTKNVFTLTDAIISEGGFGFATKLATSAADSEWSTLNANRYGSGLGDNTSKDATIGTANELKKDAGSFNAVGKFDITVNMTEMTFTLTQKANEYTLVGDEPLTGYAWKDEEEGYKANAMTLDKGVATITLTGVSLIAKTYEFKVLINDEYPAGDNEKLEISKIGTYDIVFTYTEATKTIKATPTFKSAATDATVKFAMPTTGWDAVWVHIWSAGTEINTNWPGKQLAVGTDGWYAVTLPEGSELLFHNGKVDENGNDAEGIQKTVDITAAEKCYTLGAKNNEGKYAVTEDATCAAKIEAIKVDFLKPQAWAKAYLYRWNKYGSNIWPGVEMTADADKEGWLMAEISKGDSIIFNNGLAGDNLIQSADIKGVNETSCFIWADGDALLDEDCDGKVVIDSLTISVYTPWTEPYLYIYGKKELHGAWPGMKLTAKDGKVEFKEPKGDYTFILSNGKDNENNDIKTADTKFADDDVCYVMNGDKNDEGQFLLTENEGCTGYEKVTLRFSYADWEEVAAYSYNAVGEFTAWPGTKLEKNEDGLYEVEVVRGANVIFNNNGKGEQAADGFVATKDSCLTLNDQKVTIKLDDCVAQVNNYYIMGDFVAWKWNAEDKDIVAMTVTDKGEGKYEFVVNNFVAEKDTEYEYKLIKNLDWNGYQLPAEGNNKKTFDKAGVYTLTFRADVKAHTLELFAQDASITIDHLTVLGDLTAAAEAEAYKMTKQEDGTYTLVIDEKEVQAKQYKYQVRVALEDEDADPIMLPATEAAYTFSKAGKYSLTFTADVVAMTVSLKVENLKQNDFYLVPNMWATADQPNFRIHAWNANDSYDIDMALAEGETQVYTAKVPDDAASLLFFRIDPNNEKNIWNQTDNLTIPTDGNNQYTITGYVDNANSTGVWGKFEAGALVPKYYVVGSESVFGAAWKDDDKAYEANIMEAQEDGTFALEIEGVELAVGQTREFKVISITAGEEQWFGDENGENLKIALKADDKDGVYTLLFTFNAETKAAAYTATLTEEKEIEIDEHYFIVGVEALTGYNNWAVEDDNEMTVSNGIATLVKEGVALKAGKDYEYKVRSGDNYYPDGLDNNKKLNVSANGIYTVTFTFNLLTEEVKAEVERTDDYTPKTGLYLLVGEDEYLLSENGENEYKVEGIDLEKNDVLYLMNYDEEQSFGFHHTDLATWTVSDDNHVTVGETGNFNLYIKFENFENYLYIVNTATLPKSTYFLVGDAPLTGVNWANEDYSANEMTVEDGVATIELKDVELIGEQEYFFKVIEQIENQDQVIWHGAGENFNENDTVKEEKSGKYDIVFTYTISTKALAYEATLIKEMEINNKYVVAGDTKLMGELWNGSSEANLMTLTEGVATLVKEGVKLAAGNYEYKIVKNGSQWIPDGDNKILAIANNGEYNITFTYKEASGAISAEAVKTADYTPKTGYAIILNGEDLIDLTAYTDEYGDGFKAENVTLAMNDDLFLHEYENDTDFGFTDTDNEDFGVTEGHVKVGKAGTYNLYLKIENNNNNLYIVDTKDVPETVYTVAGASTVLGTEWNQADENNDMELVEGVYTLVKTGVQLPAGNYEYKVVTNHSWDNNNYPESNASFRVAEDGIYTVTFTFIESTKDVKADATKTGEWTAPETVYTIVGDKPLMGYNWKDDEGYEVNDMTKGQDGKYTLTLTEVELVAANYEYKVIGNHSYDIQYPAGTTNQTLEIAATGIYTIVFTYDGEETLTAVATKTADVKITYEYYIVGEIPTLTWDPAETTAKMTEQSDGTYLYTIERVTLEARKYEYKLTANHAWGIYELPAEGNNDYVFNEAGDYKLEFRANVTEHTLELIATKLGTETGLDEINQTLDTNAPMYNILGQRVDENYIGIIIQNGMKFLRK